MHLLLSPQDLSYAVFGLVEGVSSKASMASEVLRVETRPEGILQALLTYLEERHLHPDNLDGIVVVTGPGSGTALRTGMAIINTIAFVYHLPLVAVSNAEGKDIEHLLSVMDLSKTTDFAVPTYDREPRITKKRSEEGCG